MKPFVRSALLAMGMSVGAFAFSMGMAQAETPKDTLVMAFVIDDIITLDPGEYSASAMLVDRARIARTMSVRLDVVRIQPSGTVEHEVNFPGSSFLTE